MKNPRKVAKRVLLAFLIVLITICIPSIISASMYYYFIFNIDVAARTLVHDMIFIPESTEALLDSGENGIVSVEKALRRCESPDVRGPVSLYQLALYLLRLNPDEREKLVNYLVSSENTRYALLGYYVRAKSGGKVGSKEIQRIDDTNEITYMGGTPPRTIDLLQELKDLVENSK